MAPSPLDQTAEPIAPRRGPRRALAAAVVALTLTSVGVTGSVALAPQAADAATATVAPVAGAVTKTTTAHRTTKLPAGARVRLYAKSWHRNIVTTAPHATVGALLTAANVRADSNDRLRLGPASAADKRAGVAGKVTVQRVTVANVRTKKHVKRTTKVVKSSKRYKVLGSYVKRKGHAGTRSTVTRITRVDGRVTARKVVRTHSTMVKKVVVKGTRKSPKHATVAYSKAIAKDLVRRKHWSTRQYTCLVSLWNRESGWRVSAHNSSSGAHGIPQALPGRKMASAGPGWRTNAKTQITWGLGYIKGRYHTPCGALSHSHHYGWY
ncbi:G5 domain-containing protein [Luteimicrobium sp. NPDC057192]|uniref:aggregation-promoting factor C-terminal-like domain-containing protein n=1 Tax=Luteimicrobium sp. NPDC057192 TaxID=3346042 RepID=UPI0036254E40